MWERLFGARSEWMECNRKASACVTPELERGLLTRCGAHPDPGVQRGVLAVEGVRPSEGRAEQSLSPAGPVKGQREALSCCLSRPTLPVLRALSLPPRCFSLRYQCLSVYIERPSLPLKDFEGIYLIQVSLCGGSFS